MQVFFLPSSILPKEPMQKNIYIYRNERKPLFLLAFVLKNSSIQLFVVRCGKKMFAFRIY